MKGKINGKSNKNIQLFIDRDRNRERERERETQQILSCYAAAKNIQVGPKNLNFVAE